MSYQTLGRLYHEMKTKLGIGEDEGDSQPRPGRVCSYCTWKERVLSTAQVTQGKLKRGSHISVGGLNYQMNIGKKQVNLYTHHAIVKNVQPLDDSAMELTLIQFISTPFDVKIKIRETTEIKNLHYDEIYIVHYRHKTRDAERIVRRAEELLEMFKKQKSKSHGKADYDFLSGNCEHMCNFCCVGSDESPQVHCGFNTLIQKILAPTGSIGSKILKVALKLAFMSVEDVTGVASRALVAVPWGVLGGFVVLYLIYCAWKHIDYNQMFKQGKICKHCCGKFKSDLWLRFFVYCATQAGGLGLLEFVMTTVASKGIIAGLLIAVSVLSLFLMWAIPKVKAAFCSPFEGQMKEIRACKDIKKGDVLRLGRGFSAQDAIVSRVSEKNSIKGHINVITYKTPKWFGKKQIVEEERHIDPTTEKIEKYDYSIYKVHQPDIVVARARLRLGEEKYGVISNRSCHFCHWAKVNEPEADEVDSEPVPQTEIVFDRTLRLGETVIAKRPINIDHRRNKKHATKTLGKRWARTTNDIKAGQIIEFKYGMFWHKGVSTEVTFSEEHPSKLSVSVVHYGAKRVVCEEEFDFDLRYVDVWLYDYHPLYRYNTQKVIERARDKAGRKKYNVLTNRSSHLAEQIVEKGRNELIENLNTLIPGDIVSFYYWSILHDGVVTDVMKEESKLPKGKGKGKIKVVHYALDHIFATRTIKEEDIDIDLEKDHLYIKHFEGYITYPHKRVVDRARERIGEQRFSINGNTSWDLVHWAKVVQTPAIVTKREQNNIVGDGKDYLVPQVGIQYEHFQIVRALTWSELQVGMIVEYRYYTLWHPGVLVEKDEVHKKIKVIHYGTAHIFATRKIIKETLDCDLRYDDLWLYRCDPRLCQKEAEIIKCAHERLGEKNWKAGNRSIDFCKTCVLKPNWRELVDKSIN